MATKNTGTTDNNAGGSPCTPEASKGQFFKSEQMTELFGEVLHAYTRKQALEDGVLVDITSIAKEAGFCCPVAITRAAWADCVEWSESDSKRQMHQDETGRLWDVVYMSSLAARRGGTEIRYQIHRLPRGGRGVCGRVARLKMLAGSGDNGELVITILIPGEY